MTIQTANTFHLPPTPTLRFRMLEWDAAEFTTAAVAVVFVWSSLSSDAGYDGSGGRNNTNISMVTTTAMTPIVNFIMNHTS